MSRKGKQPIAIPKGVEVTLSPGLIKAKGPKGSLERQIPSLLQARKDGEVLYIELNPGQEENSHLHGLYRSLVANLIQGVAQGFEKRLEMIGVGYRASIQGREVDLLIGLSHPTRLPIPQGIEVKVEKNTQISIQGADKHQVGQFAAIVRSKKPPEPYQGKGIRYVGEFVRKKAGKTASKK